MTNVYSQVKIFHYPEKIASLPYEKEITAPIHVRIKPTNKCNHRCHYCAYRDVDLQLGKDMQESDSISRAKMIEICHDIVNMHVKAVTYSGGGEPLLYPYLLEASQILHNGGVKLGCLTNGSLLYGAIADFFAHNGTWIRVSMDGWDNASYSYYRAVKDGEYDKILNNMENFVKKGGQCMLGVSYIIDAYNAAHILPMLSRLKDVGVKSVKLSACIVSDDPKVNTVYHAPHFVQVSEHIAEASASLACDTFELQDSFHNREVLFAKKYSWCPMLQLNSVIGADSRVYSCQDKAYDMHAGFLGSLKGQSFEKFWMHDKQKFFTINPSLVCNHHCVANGKNKILLDFLQINKGHLGFV